MDTLDRAADIVLVDSPPVLPVSDAMVIAGLVDATLLVAFSGESSRRALHRSYQLLRQVDANIVGSILNNVKAETGYGYGYYRTHSPSANGSSNGDGSSRRRRDATL